MNVRVEFVYEKELDEFIKRMKEAGYMIIEESEIRKSRNPRSIKKLVYLEIHDNK